MDVPYRPWGCEKCPCTNKLRPYTIRTLANLLLVHLKTSHIPRTPINRKREIQYVLAFLRCQGQRLHFALQNYNKKMIYANKNAKKCRRRMVSRQMNETAGITSPTNRQNRNSTAGKQPKQANKIRRNEHTLRKPNKRKGKKNARALAHVKNYSYLCRRFCCA